MTGAEIVIPEMNLEEFHNDGFLLEVNRQFFHPLGMALFIKYDEQCKAIELGIYDWRHDPEGCLFEDITAEDKEKAKNIQRLWDDKATIRMERFGFVIQPLEPLHD